MIDVTETQLRNLQTRVRQQLDAAVQALDDYDRARSHASLPPFLPQSHRVSLREAALYSASDAFHRSAAFAGSAAGPKHFVQADAAMILNAAVVARGEVLPFPPKGKQK